MPPSPVDPFTPSHCGLKQPENEDDDDDELIIIRFFFIFGGAREKAGK